MTRILFLVFVNIASFSVSAFGETQLQIREAIHVGTERLAILKGLSEIEYGSPAQPRLSLQPLQVQANNLRIQFNRLLQPILKANLSPDCRAYYSAFSRLLTQIFLQSSHEFDSDKFKYDFNSLKFETLLALASSLWQLAAENRELGTSTLLNTKQYCPILMRQELLMTSQQFLDVEINLFKGSYGISGYKNATDNLRGLGLDASNYYERQMYLFVPKLALNMIGFSLASARLIKIIGEMNHLVGFWVQKLETPIGAGGMIASNWKDLNPRQIKFNISSEQVRHLIETTESFIQADKMSYLDFLEFVTDIRNYESEMMSNAARELISKYTFIATYKKKYGDTQKSILALESRLLELKLDLTRY